ncbi:amidase family protein [Phenylobacterium sp. J426]|uniref:amidase family protein n=1 Tax=Phenylobacterium sp. J426 TaxID=2898439 RepID=UPI0035AE9561
MAARAPGADLTSARIALWVDEPLFALDPQVRDAVLRLAGELGAAGASVEPITSPVDAHQLLGAYQTLLGAVLGEDLPPRLVRSMEFTRPLAKLALRRGAGPLSTAAMTVAYTARHTDWLAADAVRARLRHEILGLFDRFDAILAPIAPTAAFPHDPRPFQKRILKGSDGATWPYVSMLQWIALPAALRLPATAVPAGLSASGLPIGAQLIGPPGADGRLLALAQSIDEDIRGFQPPPL